MGQRTKQGNTVATYVKSFDTLDVSDTILEGASFILPEQDGSALTTWCELGVAIDGPSFDKRTLILSQGLLSPGEALSWTGRLHLDAESYLYGYARGSTSFVYKLTAFVHKPNRGQKNAEQP